MGNPAAFGSSFLSTANRGRNVPSRKFFERGREREREAMRGSPQVMDRIRQFQGCETLTGGGTNRIRGYSYGFPRGRRLFAAIIISYLVNAFRYKRLFSAPVGSGAPEP